MLDIEKIKRLRDKLGLTLEAAAEKAGFSSRQHWYNIENGLTGGGKGVTLGTLEKLARALDCKPKDLLK